MGRWFEMTEEDLKASWDIHWRWEWLINNEWPTDRLLDSHAARSVEHLAPLLGDLGVRRVLDVTCGFGLKSILLAGKGFEVCGSDISAVAIERAHRLAQREGLNVELKEAPWSRVDQAWGRERFDCVLCDALSWTPTEAILSRACASFWKVLGANGVLVWSGAPVGEPDRDSEELALETYRGKPAFEAHGPWRLANGQSVLRIVSRELDGEAVVVHRAYLAPQGESVALEVSSLPEPTCWSWSRMWGILAAAGFSSSETVESRLGTERRRHNVTRK